MAVKISKTSWGIHQNNELFLFKMVNDSGAYAEITNYGAAIVSIVVPNKLNEFENVVAGFPVADGYINDTCYIGSTIGRYANRISKARFKLDGGIYNLEANDDINTNHGGYSGFNYRVFNASINNSNLQLTLNSPDGDGGYPGNLDLTVTYAWSDNNELLINYKAVTDKSTIANFTNHSYFNLSAFKNKIHQHTLTINATHVLESLPDHTPTGQVISAGENMFCNNKLSDKFKEDNGHVRGLNLYYIIDKNDETSLNYGATLTDNASGRMLQVYTTYPGIFLYTGDYLTSTYLNPQSKLYTPFDGVCLECQHYPDSINHPGFPQAILREGQVYNQSILFKFSTL